MEVVAQVPDPNRRDEGTAILKDAPAGRQMSVRTEEWTNTKMPANVVGKFSTKVSVRVVGFLNINLFYFEYR